MTRELAPTAQHPVGVEHARPGLDHLTGWMGARGGLGATAAMQ